MKKIVRYLLIPGLLGAVMCGHRSPEQRYMDFINDPENKLTQRIKIGEIMSTIKWLPQRYNKLISGGMADTADHHYYFNLRFDQSVGKKPEKDKAIYLEFDIERDFVLMTGQDSLMPVICQRIHNGIAGSYEYLLAFEKPINERRKDFSVLYNDKIFGIGTIAFVYKEEDLNKIPKLIAKKSS